MRVFVISEMFEANTGGVYFHACAAFQSRKAAQSFALRLIQDTFRIEHPDSVEQNEADGVLFSAYDDSCGGFRRWKIDEVILED